jgi:hypothetical protein
METGWTWELAFQFIISIFAFIGFTYVLSSIWAHIRNKRVKNYDLDIQISKFLNLTMYMDIHYIVPKATLKEMRESFLKEDYETVKKLWLIGSTDYRDHLLGDDEHPC